MFGFMMPNCVAPEAAQCGFEAAQCGFMKPNMLAQTVYFLNVKNLSEMKQIKFNRKFILFTWIKVWKMDEDSTQIPNLLVAKTLQPTTE